MKRYGILVALILVAAVIGHSYTSNPADATTETIAMTDCTRFFNLHYTFASFSDSTSKILNIFGENTNPFYIHDSDACFILTDFTTEAEADCVESCDSMVVEYGRWTGGTIPVLKQRLTPQQMHTHDHFNTGIGFHLPTGLPRISLSGTAGWSNLSITIEGYYIP